MGGFPRGRQHLNINDSQTTKQKGVISVNQPCHNRERETAASWERQIKARLTVRNK